MLVVDCLAGDAADFLKAAGIEQAVDPLPYRQPATGVLPRHSLLAAKFAGEGLTVAQFRQFRFPTDVGCSWCRRRGRGRVELGLSSAIRFLSMCFAGPG